MANNKIVIISFKTAYQIFQELDLAKKRKEDQGTSDFEVVGDILHHERVELIDFSDENLDPERLVSRHLFAILNISMVWYKNANAAKSDATNLWGYNLLCFEAQISPSFGASLKLK